MCALLLMLFTITVCLLTFREFFPVNQFQDFITAEHFKDFFSNLHFKDFYLKQLQVTECSSTRCTDTVETKGDH